MWELVNDTPFEADRTFLRDRDGAEVLVVVVKATFSLEAGAAPKLADVQEPIAHAPVHDGEPGASSLRHESDIALSKKATDVLVHGHAYPAHGKRSIAVEAALLAGPIEKRIWVVGDRFWQTSMGGLRMTDPQPFDEMPIVFERAFGGTVVGDGAAVVRDERNPVGVGFALARDALAGTRVPNLEDPVERIAQWDQRPRPMSFGPIDRSWAPRLGRAGTHDEQWERERMPLVPLDFDDRFYQAAPEDQQVPGHLCGGEPFELRHLTPDGVLRFTLPEVPLRIRSRVAGRTVRHRASLHTVVVEPDRRRLILVWQSSLPCHHTIHTLLGTTVSVARSRP